MSTCRICACTDDDCTWCIVLTEEPCYWAEPDLCSACQCGGDLSLRQFPFPDDIERARYRGRLTMLRARRRSGRVPGFMPMAEHAEKVMRVCVRLECAKRRASA
jgi:hypothetical protein